MLQMPPLVVAKAPDLALVDLERIQCAKFAASMSYVGPPHSWWRAHGATSGCFAVASEAAAKQVMSTCSNCLRVAGSHYR